MLEFILNLIGDLIGMAAVCFAAFLGAKYAIDTKIKEVRVDCDGCEDCENCENCDDCQNCEGCHNCQKPIYEPANKEE